MRRILFDTSAWIEYLEGTEEGKHVEELLDQGDAEIYTSIISIAELSDVFRRGDVDTDLEWEEIQDFLQLNSAMVNLKSEEMAEAGALKVKRRGKFDDFGLIDAIILVSSRTVDAELLTSDSHLTGEENSLQMD